MLPDRLLPKLGAAFLSRARLHLGATNYGDALNDCSSAARLDERSAEPLLLEAEVRMCQGDYASAIEVCQAVLKLQSKCAPALGLSGLARVHSGDVAKAREELKQALQLDDQCVKALYGTGILALKERAYVDAQKHLEHLLKVDPQHVDALNALACCDVVQGDTAKGRRRLDTLLGLSPRHAAALNHRSLLHAYDDNEINAWSDLQQALAIDPAAGGYGGPWTYLVKISGDPEAALNSNRTVIPAEFTYAYAYQQRGYVRGQRSDDAGALCDCTVAARLNPTDYVSRANCGSASYALGDYKGAIEHCRLSLLINPAYNLANDTLILALVVTEQTKEVAAAVDAFSKVSKDAEALNNVAWQFVDPETEAKYRNPKLALKLAEKAVSVSKRKIAYLLDTLAVAHFQNGNPKQALQIQEEILLLLGEKDAEHYTLAQANEALKRYRDAIK
jgi:tetratricopeptide (TPR) repeat protein